MFKQLKRGKEREDKKRRKERPRIFGHFSNAYIRCLTS